MTKQISATRPLRPRTMMINVSQTIRVRGRHALASVGWLKHCTRLRCSSATLHLAMPDAFPDMCRWHAMCLWPSHHRMSPLTATRYRSGPMWWLMEVGGLYAELRVSRMAAALSCYAIISLAPLLVIVSWIAGMIFGDEQAGQALTAQFRLLSGQASADVVSVLIDHGRRTESQGAAAVLGIAGLLIGATGVFVELQDSLNAIWHVRTRTGRMWLSLVRSRLLSFGMVFGMVFLLIISLAVSAVLGAITPLFGPVQALQTLLADSILSLVVMAALFAGAFRFLPDVRLRWGDVWSGALVTAMLSVVGKHLIGLYLGKANISSAYGAMGSLVVLLVWIYYTAQIFLIGAVISRVRTRRNVSPVVPIRDAEWIPG